MKLLHSYTTSTHLGSDLVKLLKTDELTCDDIIIIIIVVNK